MTAETAEDARIGATFAAPLVPATLLRRYKRFLADVRLEDGREVTAHCANPGSMLGLSAPGTRIWLEPNDNPARKLRFTWRLVELGDGHMAGIDTSVPNRVVGAALRAGAIPGISGDVRAEVKYGHASRVDFLVSDGARQTFVEVKNVHLRRSGDLAEFPDCVTARGAKHLAELADMVAAGHRAVMLYLIQRTDCTRLAFARDLDPGYAEAFASALKAGVEARAFGCHIGVDGVFIAREVPVLDPETDREIDPAGARPAATVQERA